MATKKTTQKKKNIPELPELPELPKDLEIIAGEKGVDGAITTLQNMSAMLDVMSAIDPNGEPMDSAELARVFYLLHSWTEFARRELEAWYNETETAA